MFTIIAHGDDDDVTNAGDGEKIVNEVENVLKLCFGAIRAEQ